MKAFITLLLLLTFGFGSELKTLIDFTLKNNPRLKSYENLKMAFEYRSKFSLSLPNPQVAVAFNNLDTEKFFPRKENPMSSFGLYIAQRYVLPSKRLREARIYDQKVSEIDRMREVYEKDLIKEVKVLYWEFAYSFEMERILKDIKREIESLLEITEEKYRYGKALLSDLIMLRVEMLKVEEKIAEARRIREVALKKIYALAGGEIPLRGSPLEIQPFPKEFDPERNVRVRLTRETVEVLKRELERAKVEHYPDLFISAGYMIRPDIPDLITLRLGATVPIWYRDREKMLVLEKTERINSKLYELEDIKLRVTGDFRALESTYRIKKEILSTVEREIEEKRKEIDALLIAYRYERTDIREILRAYRILWSLEFDRARLIKELNQTVAKAEALQ
ncbi:MAG: TolC family protein [Aquificota bacterium]|nr:TolC family protein [Aquificota bacterium]